MKEETTTNAKKRKFTNNVQMRHKLIEIRKRKRISERKRIKERNKYEGTDKNKTMRNQTKTERRKIKRVK